MARAALAAVLTGRPGAGPRRRSITVSPAFHVCRDPPKSDNDFQPSEAIKSSQTRSSTRRSPGGRLEREIRPLGLSMHHPYRLSKEGITYTTKRMQSR